jgi:hypothetical protein
MKTLSDIIGDSELQKRILWDLTPEEIFRSVEIRGQADLDNEINRREALTGYYFYIDVSNLTPRLVLFENRADGTGGVVGEIKGLRGKLRNAIEEVGGSIARSGHYPINAEIMEWLKKKLQGSK